MTEQDKWDSVQEFAYQYSEDSDQCTYWQKAVYILASGMKGIPSLEKLTTAKALSYVRRWYENYCPSFAGEEEIYEEFVRIWPNIKEAYRFQNAEQVEILMREAVANPCAEAKKIGVELFPGMKTTVKMLSLLIALRNQAEGGSFFLSTLKAGQLLGITDRMRIWRMLRTIEQAGLIKTVKKGTQHRATRYQWAR